MEPGGKPSTAQMVVLATSSALTAIFYSVYRSRAATVARLKEAQKIPIDEDLKNLLLDAPGRCVPYAVIEGTVRSVKETLSSQFVENCRGVIERLTLKEEKMVWNRTTHIWNSTEKIIHQRTNTVPFALGSLDEAAAEASVRVLRPLDASELDLETTYDKFHASVQSLTSVIGHFISGERPKGVRETEEMLRLGASVTGVGQLVLDNGLVKLQPPKRGLPYFLTRLDYDALLRKQARSAALWRLLLLLSGAAAAATLLYVLWRRYERHRRRRRERGAVEEFRKRQRERMRHLNVEEAGVAPDACSVCLSRQRTCAFLECGHVCACAPCYQALPAPKTCPICRAPIVRVVPLYNS